MPGFDPNLDHLVYATPDLEATVADVERRLGVRAAEGGRHMGAGSRNALLALGDTCYLEIIGPDREQPEPERARPFGMDSLGAARLVTWAAKGRELEARVRAARAAGFDPGDVHPMSRDRPDGVRLEWRLTRADELRGDGLVPFLIDWGATPSPATTSPQGCRLIALRAEHPSPASILEMCEALGVELDVSEGAVVRLVASIETPNGPIELA